MHNFFSFFRRFLLLVTLCQPISYCLKIKANTKLQGMISTPQRYKNHWKIEIFLSIKKVKERFIAVNVFSINNIPIVNIVMFHKVPEDINPIRIQGVIVIVVIENKMLFWNVNLRVKSMRPVQTPMTLSNNIR